MANSNVVNFQINVNGNAYQGIAQLGEAVERTTGKFKNLTKDISNFANIGFVVNHVTSLFRSAGAVVEKYSGAYKAQAEAETKLAAVMRRTIGATSQEIESVKQLASAQQRLGVIGDELQLSGAQELATYVGKTQSIHKLIPAINDMAAQQYGLNASQEQYTQLATMVGKVIQGQTGALSRYGYTFTQAQEKVLKFGTEQQRAAMLAEIIEESVGGVNEALAQTPEGKQKQIANNMGDIDERIGSLLVRLKSGLNPAMEMMIEKVNRIIDTVEQKDIISKVTAGMEKLTNFITGNIKAIGAIAGAYLAYATTMKVVNAYNAVAAFFEGALWQAVKRKTVAVWDSCKALWANISCQGTYMTVTLGAVVATHAFANAIRAVGKAIYSIPIIGWIAAGIALLITAFKILWEKCEGFRKVVFGVWEAIKAVFYNIGIVATALWENILEPYFLFWWNLAKTVAAGIWEALKWCFDNITSVIKSVGNFFSGFWKEIVSGATAAWQWIAGTVQTVVEFVSELLGSAWMWITEKLGALGEWLSINVTEPVKEAFAGMWDYIKNILNNIVNKLSGMLAPIKALWNKLFPEDQFKDIGEAYAEGAEKGAESWANSQKKKNATANILSFDSETGKQSSILGGNHSAGNLHEGIGSKAAGDNKIKNINISIDRVIEKFTVQTTNLKESTSRIKDMVAEVVIEGINDVNLAM